MAYNTLKGLWVNKMDRLCRVNGKERPRIGATVVGFPESGLLLQSVQLPQLEVKMGPSEGRGTTSEGVAEARVAPEVVSTGRRASPSPMPSVLSSLATGACLHMSDKFYSSVNHEKATLEVTFHYGHTHTEGIQESKRIQNFLGASPLTLGM